MERENKKSKLDRERVRKKKQKKTTMVCDMSHERRIKINKEIRMIGKFIFIFILKNKGKEKEGN